MKTTNIFMRFTDYDLSSYNMPSQKLNLTDYNEDTKKFTSKMTIHLSSQPSTPIIKQKRSQSLTLDNDNRYSSESCSSFEQDETRTSVRSEIYYDNNQMPRIEMVRSIDKNLCEMENNQKKKKKTKYVRTVRVSWLFCKSVNTYRLEYIIAELVDTEEKYVENLKMIQTVNK